MKITLFISVLLSSSIAFANNEATDANQQRVDEYQKLGALRNVNENAYNAVQDINLTLAQKCQMTYDRDILLQEPIVNFLMAVANATKEKNSPIYRMALENMQCDDVNAGIEKANEEAELSSESDS